MICFAQETALEYPRTQFIGLDIAPVFPTGDVPSNCLFVQADATSFPLPFSDGEFDFVHQRFMQMSIPRTEWERLVAEFTVSGGNRGGFANHH